MSAYASILATWAKHWRALRAWGRPLDELSVEIVGRRNHAEVGCGGNGSTGTAWPVLRRVVVRAGADLPDALATILHGYAHCAAPAGSEHGPAWSTRYATAVEEVTSIPIPEEGPKLIIDRAATAAVRTWWQASGNAFAAKMLGVRS